ncbi:MAG: hypothetical protein GF364_17230 [Candidatus Lokiarchaeota archaeon]|nr:hypothetical protein [Candidatus Lokiarchaeota archaeon]
MVEIDLEKLGSVEVDSRLKLDLKISVDELFNKYPSLVEDLPNEAIQVIRDAEGTWRGEKTKGYEEEITEYFQKVKSVSGTLGVGEDEIDELENIDAIKGQEMDEGVVYYKDGELTYDKDTGAAEGRIRLSAEGNEGKVVPVALSEKLKLYLEHDGTPVEDKDSETTGILSVSNESTEDRLWDIDLELKDKSATDIKDDDIYIRELAPGEVEEQEYTIDAEIQNAVEVNEFISTLNDPEIMSYALVLNAENEIYVAITLKNTAEEAISNVSVKKFIPSEYENVEIIGSSLGEARYDSADENAVIWEIENVEGYGEAKLELRLTVTVEEIESKVRSGKILVDYNAPFSISGMGINKFDAYTNNAFYIIQSELDEKPDVFDCEFVFENKSEFMVQLVNADVYDPSDQSQKFVDVDPGEVPPLPARAQWLSNRWEFETEEGEDPQFRNRVEFFVVADHQITTTGVIDIEDIELAVSAITGDVSYDVTRLPSFKVTPFNVTMKAENTGGSDLDELVLKENIEAGYQPPLPEDIVVSLNGDEIELGEDEIIIEPNDQEPDRDHTVYIKMQNLKDTPIEAFHPGDTLEVNHPITAYKPTKDTVYHTDMLYTANTYPAGKALEVVPENADIEIEVVHIRKRFIKGKEIIALSGEGEYEITLYVVNKGNHDLENYGVADKIPDNFEYYDESEEPEVESMEGVDVLKWKIDSIAPEERYEITYKLKGEGKPSDAQVGY